MADMNAPLYDIDRPGMEVAVNSYKPGNGLAWPTLFPLKFTPKFDLKGIEGEDGIPVTADRVAFNSKAPKKTRRTVGSWSGRLGKIAVSREKDELAINEYLDLKDAASRNTEDKATAQYLVDLVYDDMDFCNKAMDYRIELDALRIGSSGKQTYDSKLDGDMVTEDVINFNVPEGNFQGVTKAWSDEENGDALGDVQKAQEYITKKGLRAPRYVILEKSAFEAVTKQKKTARRLFPRADQTLITADMITLTAINSYMSGKGWPQFLVLDSYATVEAKNGERETVKPWNSAVAVLSPEPRLGYTYWKPVPNVQNTEALQVQGKYYKMTRYSEVNPLLEVTMAEGYVQCALSNRASLVFLNVTDTTWNDGKPKA